MAKDPRALIVANWKMNPRTLEDAQSLWNKIKKAGSGLIVAAPTPYLGELARRRGRAKIGLAAQDLSIEAQGPHTGEAGASMLKSLGVTHVIIGHSERRARGETDSEVQQKLAQALRVGLSAIVCVGERERDQSGRYFSVVEAQVRDALKGIAGAKLAQVLIAYEPIWAISTATPNARPATPEDAHEMTIFIRKTLADLYGRNAAAKVKILYGGSVDDKNIADLVARSSAQGYLVGGASLRPKEFVSLVKIAHGA